MVSLEEYYEDFINEITLGANANETFTQSQFFDVSINFLVEDGIIGDDYRYVEFMSADKSLRIDGYYFEENRNILHLIIVDFENIPTIDTLNKGDLDANFRKTERFFKESLKNDFYPSLEETTEGYELAKFIYIKQSEISEVHVVLLTNKILKTKIKKLESKEIKNIPFNYDIWDIERFFQAELSKGETEAIEIDFVNEFNISIPALKANLHDSIYSSYLCVVSGDILAKLYERYGQRLLEANIRSFLQFKSGINKGIRKTIKETPDMFFAYNNGITATADGIDTDNNGNIIRLKNLQIVNGGQTTASLYTSKKNDKTDLSNIFVQMKLSIIPEGKIHEIVPNISRYANSQNKVSDSDLFANHPFHRRMEEKSRRIFAPKQQGELKQTKWYYERARGQYLEEQSKLTDAKKREFKELYPKTQLISKTDLAKVLVIFELHPYKAVQGAQIVFKYFAENIVKGWESDNANFSDIFYQFSIAKIIIFKTVQKIVASKKDDIRGQDKAIIVAYTIAAILHIIQEEKLSIDFESIWKKQELDSVFIKQINKVISKVNQFMLEQTSINGMTVLSYSKTIKCWEALKNILNISILDEEFIESLLDKSEIKSQLKDSKKEQALETEIE
ncbi:MAG: AIPR family protein, partial [Campylobacterales bacterium]|nr:AIPR family protein [Campylobacterales bacterium]